MSPKKIIQHPQTPVNPEVSSPHPVPSEDPEGLAGVTAYMMPEQGVKRIEWSINYLEFIWTLLQPGFIYIF